MKDKCKKYSKDLGCCMMLSDFSQPMPVLQPCIESPCKHYKPYTNFDKITESVESLAEFIDSLNLIDCNACVGKSICDCHIRDCKDVFIKWLQKEIDDEEDK